MPNLISKHAREILDDPSKAHELLDFLLSGKTSTTIVTQKGTYTVSCTMSNHPLDALRDEHNRKVKPQYQCAMPQFEIWINLYAHRDTETGEDYIEIPSNQTLSGHPEILDLNT